MRHSQVQPATVLVARALMLSLVLALGTASAAHSDDSVLEPARHVRTANPGRAVLAPQAPSNGDGTVPLPTPVKQPRSPRVPPTWSPFNASDLALLFAPAFTGAQGAAQGAAARLLGR